MALRSTAAGMMEAAKGFRRLKAYKHLPVLKSCAGSSSVQSTSPNELNTTLTPHNIIHGDACFAFFNKVWDIPECILFLICGLAVAANGLLGESAILAGHSKWARAS